MSLQLPFQIVRPEGFDFVSEVEELSIKDSGKCTME